MPTRTVVITCALALAALLPACTVAPSEGQLECDSVADCPDNWICAPDDLCYSSWDAYQGDDAGQQDAG